MAAAIAIHNSVGRYGHGGCSCGFCEGGHGRFREYGLDEWGGFDYHMKVYYYLARTIFEGKWDSPSSLRLG